VRRRPYGLTLALNPRLVLICRSPDADLGKLWFDAVAYGPEELEFVGKVAGRSAEYEGKLGRGKTTARSAGANEEGISRMMFG
jgi:hypothetical protein